MIVIHFNFEVVILQLKPLEYLQGSTAKLRDIIVLGMLTQLKEVSFLCAFAKFGRRLSQWSI